MRGEKSYAITGCADAATIQSSFFLPDSDRQCSKQTVGLAGGFDCYFSGVSFIRVTLLGLVCFVSTVSSLYGPRT